MKKIILTAAAMMAFGATGAYASGCELTPNKIANGWTCQVSSEIVGKSTTTSTEVLGQGQGRNCAVYSVDQTRPVYYSINPGGNIAEDETKYGTIVSSAPYRDGAAPCAAP